MRKKTQKDAACVDEFLFLPPGLLFSFVAFSQIDTNSVNNAEKKPVSKVTAQVKKSIRTIQIDKTGKLSITA